MENNIDPRRAIELRRIARAKRKRKRRLMAIGFLAFVVVLILIITISSAAKKKRKKEEEQLAVETAQIMEEQKKQEQQEQNKELRETAKAQAESYDYAGAIETIQSIDGYEQDSTLTSEITKYEEEQTKLVRYADPTTIPHVFFHSLIADNSRAFDGDYDADGYNLYMTTTYEFEQILQKMYENDFVLVSIHDIATLTTDENGNEVYEPGDIYLPEGKKPFVMSQDDLNYYEYMTDSDDDHFADAGGDGFATKIVIGEDGYPTCEYITADGQVVTGDYDIVPILEKFIQEHPDFSYKGARAALGVTGYEGVFGYRTHPDWKDILGEEKWNQEVEDAKAVAQCLRDHGWDIASHSFGHPAYGDISAERVEADSQKWEDQVQPIVGDTDIILYPFGSDIAGVEAYSGAKYDVLYEDGYRFYCNVDSTDYWVQIHDKYIRQGRRNLDGYRLYWSPHLLDDLFNSAEVLDPERPLPVPEL